MRIDRNTILALSIGWFLGGGCASLPRVSSGPAPIEPKDDDLSGCNPGLKPPDLGAPAPADPSPDQVPT